MIKHNTVNITDCRADFPALANNVVTYLDTAASAQKPCVVMDAMRKVEEEHYANIHRGLYDFSHRTTNAFEQARDRIARYLGAASENEIVFTRNATEAINLVAHSWGRTNLSKDDEIILSEMEHHANIVPWQLLREDIGFTIKIVRITKEGALDLDHFQSLLCNKTKLVSLVHLSNALGTVNPVEEITKMAKSYRQDICVLIDGCQAAGHGIADVQEIGCDFYVFSGHKLYGPTGIGVLWGREDMLNAMPPYQGGGDMIEEVTFEKTTFKPAPARFEAGTPAFVQAVGLAAALDYLEGIGWQAIAAHKQDLSHYARKKLAEIKGIHFYGPDNGAGIVSFTADWGHASDIAMILDQKKIAVRSGHHCCQPLMRCLGVEATVRASFGLYNSRDDINYLVEGLQTAQSMLS